MTTFELHRLASRDDEAIIAEIRRVAALIPGKYLTTTAFDTHSRVASSTLRRRFGGWREVLRVAGLSDRFDDTNRVLSRQEILAELRRVAEKLGATVLTKRMFSDEAMFGDGPVLREFGTWKKALKEAGLHQASLARRYSDEECFENLLNVWTHYARPPKHREMALPPSTVGPKAYVARWGTWLRALEAFVVQANAGETSHTETVPAPDTSVQTEIRTGQDSRGSRDLSLSLRYQVLVRDRFRCVICGRSPAMHPGVCLHVDHIIPWSKGGATIIANLRALCDDCNLGKRDRLEPEPNGMTLEKI